MTQLRFGILTATRALAIFTAIAASALAVDVVGNRTWTEISSIQLSPPGDYFSLAFDGSQWHISAPNHGYWWNLSPTFAPLGTTTVAGAVDMRGLDYSTTLHQIVIDDNFTGNVSFVNLNGTVQSQFSVGAFGPNGLDFDDRDSTVWVARYTGVVQQWSAAGQLLFSFNAQSPSLGVHWTGIAIDPTNNRLFLMDDSDDIYEYKMTGQLLGKIIDDPFPSLEPYVGNGVGVIYDPVNMLLRVTSQGGGLVTFHATVPEPGVAATLLIGAILTAAGRRKTRI
jgi:hypothetical protein